VANNADNSGPGGISANPSGISIAPDIRSTLQHAFDDGKTFRHSIR
jgi:hypothetical protein